MARADLLIKLVESGSSGDKQLFDKVVRALIAEEKKKQHNILAEELERVLNDSNQNKNGANPSRLFNSPPKPQIQNLLHANHPNLTLEQLFLDLNTCNIVKEIVEEQHRSDLLRSYNLEPRNRILLVGEPGNGKTSLAEAIASALMVPFYTVRYEGIIGSYLGETATRLSKLFDYICTQQCVLFFDEFDAIGKERGDENETGEIKRVVNSLLLKIDQLPSYVVIIAATNHPELLDRAVWRRFQVRLELTKPSVVTIERFLEKFEAQIEKSLNHDLKRLAKKLEGLSFSEIEEFTTNIQRKFVLSLPNSNIKNIVSHCLDNLLARYKV